ncbi:uroporphyrinogen-III synthase [Alkalicoccobacillus plakortidis]|uniref:Uroporphyrinogen-III synthase n=1 Tax=Alkalicoccobacillus plakortidis TaxID=444060 RepID=A0ABT0XH08_9BACI|nr:uroporphyrinogen-III synthase [Alkalicoccobacillus plakortidis]MCM2675196.1 uroporphyrinogen-III synthase [Alkalicoccobacillus plakortidis]
MNLTPSPLHGAKVLVTRAPLQSARFVKQIEQVGGQALQVPLINVRRMAEQKELKEVLAKLSSFKWLIFTSVNGVRFFLEHLSEEDRIKLRDSAKIAAVGSQTASELNKFGLDIHLLPKKYEAESLAEAILEQTNKGDTILIPRGNLARPLLAKRLVQAERKVNDLPVYETFFPSVAKDTITHLVRQQTKLSFLTFTSSSTVRHYVEIAQQLTNDVSHLFPDAKIVCIGNITAEEARKNGLCVAAVPEIFTTEAMVEELVRLKRSEHS